MTTLTYDDLVTIRSLLIERSQETTAILGRVEKMLGESCYDDGEPNAESLAAMEEARNWKNLPSYKSVDELMQALKDDD